MSHYNPYEDIDVKELIQPDDMYCENCKHWDASNKHEIPVYDEHGKCLKIDIYAPCCMHAVEPDAGDSIAMMGYAGHCRYHGKAFEPTEDFLNELEDRRRDLESIENTNYDLRKWLFAQGQLR